jgi:RNA polymerase sigma factor (sigma-70 family)
MPPDHPGDADLAALTRALGRGEDAAWREFHGTQGRMLFRYLLALTGGDPHRANEALQQTYLRVAKHVRPCDQPVQWEAWLRRVARTALADQRRGQGRFWRMLFRRAEEPTEADGDGAGEQAVEALHARLDAAMATLPDEARRLLDGKYLRGMAVGELAMELGLSSKAVESRLTRARESLRVLMRDEAGGGRGAEREVKRER